MRFRRYLRWTPALLGALLWAGAATAQAPSGTITGRVMDASTQRPLNGASVFVPGTSRGTLTGEDGRFILQTVPAGMQRVRVNLIGYKDQDQTVLVTAGQIATVSFSIEAEAVALREIVAIGYGTTRRSDLTGSVASVKSEQINKVAVASFQQGLAGNVAGVQVTEGDAAPGGGIRVQIRGTNSMNSGSADPLYVIDGIPIASTNMQKASNFGSVTEENKNSLTVTNPLAELSPTDIESVEVLKDASATAIYGSRGANGVVIITTKHGRSRNGNLTLNLSQGWSTVTNQIDMLNAYDYAVYNNLSRLLVGDTAGQPYGGSAHPGSLTPDSIRKIVGSGINWQDRIYRSAPVQDMQMSYGGADDQGTYMVTGNLLQQTGVVKGSQFRRGGLRMNLDRNVVSPNLRFSTNVAFTRSLNNMVRSSTLNGYQAAGVVRQALEYSPWLRLDTAHTADPRAEDPSVLSTLGSNPVRYTDEVKELDQLTRGIGGAKFTATLPKGFSVEVSLGGNYEGRTYGIYFPRTVAEGMGNNGDAVQTKTEFGDLLSENLLRFQRDFGSKGRVDAVGGFSYDYSRSFWSSNEVRNFPDDLLGGNVLQNGTDNQKPQTGLAIWELQSWLGRANYSLADRYIFTATVRADGSSKFARNHKWATFPAFAFAWRLSQEPFFKSQSLFNDLKFRASWGLSGNQAIGPYQSLPQVGGVSNTYLAGSSVAAYALTALGNPDLKWETTRQVDAGLDFAAFNNRLTGTVDYYRKMTFDLLQSISLPTNTGFSNAWLNSGKVANNGIELQASYDVLRGQSLHGLTWNVSANASHNKNKIISLGTLPQQYANRLGAGGNLEVRPFIQKPGLSIGSMWGYETDGLIKTAADSAKFQQMNGFAQRLGSYKYRDLNGDGKITTADQAVVGDANPKWIYGVNNTFTMGRWDLSALVTAVQGNSIIQTELMRWLVLAPNQNFANVPYYIYNNAYNPKTNPNGTYPMPNENRIGFNGNFYDVFVEDGSYIRLKNVQLGYKIPLPRAQSARLYVSGTNLFTHTKYTGYDPEVSAFGGTDRPGVDQGNYPGQRQITIGVSATF